METQRDNGAPDAGAFDMAMAAGWSVAMFVGIITAGIGVIVLVWPSETLVVLSVLLGIQLLVFGIWRLVHAFSGETVISPGLMGLIGVISIVVGVAILRHPFETVAVLATLLGIVWIVSGVMDIISAMADHTMRNRGLTAVAGLLGLAAGIIVVAWPEPTLTVVAWIGGIYLVVIGIMICAAAFKLRSVATA